MTLVQLALVALSWSDVRRAPPLAPYPTLKLALYQSDPVGLEKELHRRHQEMPRGTPLTIQEVTAFVAAPTATRAAALEWCATEALSCAESLHGDFVHISHLTAGKVETLFSTEVRVLRDEKTHREVIRTPLGYTLPQALRGHVELVHPTDHRPVHRFGTSGDGKRSQANREPAAWPSDCSGSSPGVITPEVLFTRYNVSSHANLSGTSVMAVLPDDGCEDSCMDPADVTALQEACRLPLSPLGEVQGNNHPSRCTDLDNCGEASGDTQIIGYMAPGARTIFKLSRHEALLDIFEELASMTSPPHVISCSFGDPETKVMDRDDHFLRTNAELAKLTAKGTTVVVASGDCGFNSNDRCDARPSSTVSTALPSFPCTSPYVTCVGGTQFEPTEMQPGGDSIGEEVAVQAGAQWGKVHGWQAHGSSGGGFSTFFARADFQSAAVERYLAQPDLLPPASFFNSSGRGIPDVATLAGLPDYEDYSTHYLRMCGRRQQGFDGTSASAPAFAGVLAHLNSVRLEAGKPPLGWANPFLYSAAAADPAAFFDVTQGDNQYAFQTGFSATTGWDAVTGLGSPNTGVLARLAAEY